VAETDALPTRETLLQRVRRPRDQSAWQEFANAYNGFIHRIACQMGLQHHDAEEVCQNVMLQLWKKLPEFQYDASRGRFRGWLCTMTGNEVRMLVRRRSQDADRLSPEKREALRREIEAAHVIPDEDFAECEWKVYVTLLAWNRVKDSLGKNERRAFELTSRGLSAEKVASKLGITVSSVYVYRKRVKDILTREVMQMNLDLD